MTWAYSGKPKSNEKDQVRFLIGDTDDNDKLIQDEEIEFLLDDEGSPIKAAIRGAESLAAKFAREVDESVGQVKQSLSQRHKHYLDLAKRLKTRMAIKKASPFAGGLSKIGKQGQELDGDRVKPEFTKDLHDRTDITDSAAQIVSEDE